MRSGADRDLLMLRAALAEPVSKADHDEAAFEKRLNKNSNEKSAAVKRGVRK